MVYFFPKSLEFLLCKVFIERIFLDLGFVSVGEHVIQNTFIVDSLNKCMYSFRHRLQFFRELCNRIHCHIIPVLVRNLSLHIHIAILNEVELNGVSNVIINECRNIINLDILAFEVLACCNCRSVVKNCLNIRLQVGNKIFIAFTGYHCQQVYVMNRITAAFYVHTVSELVDAKSEPSAHFLSLGRLAV